MTAMYFCSRPAAAAFGTNRQASSCAAFWMGIAAAMSVFAVLLCAVSGLAAVSVLAILAGIIVRLYGIRLVCLSMNAPFCSRCRKPAV